MHARAIKHPRGQARTIGQAPMARTMPVAKYEAMEEAMEDIPLPPDDMTPEQGENWRRIRQIARRRPGFDELAIDVIARDPKMTERYISQHRKATVEKVAAVLSECREVPDMHIDTIGTLLNLPEQDAMGLVAATRTLSEASVKLTPDEVKEAIDLARVIHVMEDEQMELAKSYKGQEIAEAYEEKIMDSPAPDRGTMARLARARLKK